MKPVVADWQPAQDGERRVWRLRSQDGKLGHDWMRPTSVLYYGYGRELLFCTLACAYRFACDTFIKKKT